MSPPYWTNKFDGKPVGTKNNRRGQQIVIREVTMPCKRCTEPFTFQMTTKPHNHCAKCKEIIMKAKRLRDIERVQESRRAGTFVPREQRRKLRKLPYAGHPRSKIDA